jgi:hypothetical protein
VIFAQTTSPSEKPVLGVAQSDSYIVIVSGGGGAWGKNESVGTSSCRIKPKSVGCTFSAKSRALEVEESGLVDPVLCGNEADETLNKGNISRAAKARETPRRNNFVLEI